MYGCCLVLYGSHLFPYINFFTLEHEFSCEGHRCGVFHAFHQSNCPESRVGKYLSSPSWFDKRNQLSNTRIIVELFDRFTNE